MNTLYMKINSFEESTYSLLVSFASDTTKSSDPSDYPSYAFQPMNMWPDISDASEIERRIAMAGLYHAQQQENEEKFIADPAKVQEYRNMVGDQKSYPVSDLAPPSDDPIIEV